MADIKLGLSGSEITLPVMKWLGGNQPDLPVSVHKQIEETIMSDGTSNWAFFKKKHIFVWENGYVTKSELDQIKALYNYNQALRYQNNNEDATWYDVILLSPFEYGPVRTDILSLERYWCRITMREA